jgi:regulatory protein
MPGPNWGRQATPPSTPRLPDSPTGGRITAITAQVRDPERVNVHLDGAFAFGLPRTLAQDEGLRIGDDLSPERVAALRAADDVAKATTAALGLLARRPRSTREVRDRLRRRAFAPEAIDAAMARLEGWNYVDDADFARYWVENRAAHKPRGRRLLEQELRHKGVARETIGEAIDAADLDEREAALGLARTKLRTYAGLEPPVARRRLAAFLARRGYGFDVVRLVLDELFGEDDEADGEDP